MAGLCGVVEWAMEGAYAHLVSTSGVLGFALSLVNALVVSVSGNTWENWVWSFWLVFLRTKKKQKKQKRRAGLLGQKNATWLVYW